MAVTIVFRINVFDFVVSGETNGLRNRPDYKLKTFVLHANKGTFASQKCPYCKVGCNCL